MTAKEGELSKTRVLAIAGSLRRESYNRKLLYGAAAVAPPNVQVGVFDKLGDIPMFSEDRELPDGEGPPSVQRLVQLVARSDALLISTPEYCQSIPGVLKNAFEWLSRAPSNVLIGKPVAIVGVTVGRWGTRLAQAALRQVLHATECVQLPSEGVYLTAAETLFDPEGKLIHEQTRATLTKLLGDLAQFVDRNATTPVLSTPRGSISTTLPSRS